MKRTLPLLAALALFACAPIAPPNVVSSASATIGFGGQAMLNGLLIRPIALVEDSRCPINARCVWAGRLVLRAEVAGQMRDLTLGHPLAIDGATLILAAALPAKLAGTETPPGAYRFTFEVRR